MVPDSVDKRLAGQTRLAHERGWFRVAAVKLESAMAIYVPARTRIWHPVRLVGSRWDDCARWLNTRGQNIADASIYKAGCADREALQPCNRYWQRGR